MDLPVSGDVLLPANLAAARVRVSRQLLNWWRRTGKLTPAAADRTGRPLYRLGDVVQVERQTRRSPQSHRYASTSPP